MAERRSFFFEEEDEPPVEVVFEVERDVVVESVLLRLARLPPRERLPLEGVGFVMRDY